MKKAHVYPNDHDGADKLVTDKLKVKDNNEPGDPDSIGESNMESGEMPKRGE